MNTKIWFVTKAGDHFTHPPGFNQVTIALLLYFSLSTILHIVQTLSGPKNPPFFSFLFSLAFLQSLID